MALTGTEGQYRVVRIIKMHGRRMKVLYLERVTRPARPRRRAPA